MESYLPTSDRHTASWIFSDGPSKQLGVVKLRHNVLKLFFIMLLFYANGPVSASVNITSPIRLRRPPVSATHQNGCGIFASCKHCLLSIRRPNCWTDHDQIWHAYADRPVDGSYLKKIDPPPKGGRSGNFRGGKKIKSPGNVMNCPENQ